MVDTASDLSPLQEVERVVQDRARTLALDTDHDRTALAGLISEAVDQWSIDHKRGTRPFDLADPERVAERAMRNLTGYGPPRSPAGRRRRLGDHDQRAGGDLRQAPPGSQRLPRRGLPRRRPRGAHPHQDPRRRVQLAPQARPHRGPPGRPARRRLAHPHRPRRHRPRRAPARQHPQVHQRGLPRPGPARGPRHVEHRRRPLPGRLRQRPHLDRVRRRARCRQDHHAVVLLRRARSEPARGRGRRGARSRRAGGQRRPHADPPGPWRSPRRRPCADWSPGSCAWPPTSPSSARSEIGRPCRSC